MNSRICNCNRPLTQMGTTKVSRNPQKELLATRLTLALEATPAECPSAGAHKITISEAITQPRSLRQRSTHEDGARIRAQTARPDQEYNVLPGFQLRLQLMECGFAGDRLLIDLQDHVATTDAD